ncbi:RAD1 DNA repair protein RAD1 [Candida maltosa Xu316]
MSLFVQDEEENQQEIVQLDHETGSSSTIPVTIRDSEQIPIFPEREINCILPLKYQQEILEDTLTKDGLLILGRGLGWDIITANLLHALSTPFVNLGTNKTKKGLIFILNATDDELTRLQEELSDLKNSDNDEDDCVSDPITVITGDSQSYKRKTIYKERGGLISLNPRLLITDILSFTLDPNDITGLFVFHAERVKETSNDAFAINLFRDKNNWGPLSTKLKILRISNVFLWPRFHMIIQKSFNIKNSHDRNKQGKLVNEISLKPTYLMEKIQSGLLSCVAACLSELKRKNDELYQDYWSIENVHDPDFIKNIRNSLLPYWHRISFTSKQILKDLGFISGLIKELISLDSIGFYQQVQAAIDSSHKVQAAISQYSSPWLNLNEAATVARYAKERAFGKEDGTYKFEELPKWRELGKLVKDILLEKDETAKEDKNQGPVLIVCSERKIARQLTELLENMSENFGFRKYMINKLNSYSNWEKQINPLIKKISLELEGNSNNTTGDEDDEQLSMSKTFTRNGQPVSKRRRTRGGSLAASRGQTLTQKAFEAVEIDEDILQALDKDIVEPEPEEPEVIEVVDPDPSQYSIKFEHINKGQQIIIQAYNDFYNASILQELHPSHIIMYEPNLSFLRRIEIYQAINQQNPAQVYFMYYKESVEEERHLIEIKKEKESFTKLIHQKSELAKHFSTEQDNVKFQINRNNVVNTRIAGGSRFRTEADEMQVIVDTREFGSSTPNLLYRIGITVIPCMLTVGDYILSPQMCVERKSVDDFIQSFKSGRLYTQCNQMFRYYETPILLLEFDANKSFSLQPLTEASFRRFGTSNNNNNNNSAVDEYLLSNAQATVQSKIMRLLYVFPKLKIVWSSSPYESAQIFLQLKASQKEPDVGNALDKGANKSVVTEDGNPAAYNEEAIDFIQNIPGINGTNYLTLIEKVKSIQDLVCLSKEEFIDILGSENGKKAFNFINKKVT